MTLYVLFQSNIEFEEYLTGPRDTILKTMAKAAKSNEKYTTLNMSQNQSNSSCSLMAKYKRENVKILYALRKGDSEEKFKKALENSNMYDLLANRVGKNISFFMNEKDWAPQEMDLASDLFEEFQAENFKDDTSLNSLIANANSILSNKCGALKKIMQDIERGIDSEKIDVDVEQETVGEVPDMVPVMENPPENEELTDPVYKDSLENGVELADEDKEEEEDVDIGAPSFKIVTDESKPLLVNEEGQFSAVEPVKEVTVDMKSVKAEEQDDGSLNIMIGGAVADAGSEAQAEKLEGIGEPIEDYIGKDAAPEKEEVDAPSLIPEEFCDPTDDYDEKDPKQEIEDEYHNPARSQIGKLPSWINDMIN